MIEDRSSYYLLSNKIKKGINEFADGKWSNFLEKVGDYSISTRKFWQEINKTRNTKQSSTIPNLVVDEVLYSNDIDKANILAETLSKVFSNDGNINDFDENHKEFVTLAVKNLDSESCEFIPFTVGDLMKKIKHLKIKSSPGGDDIHNLFIKETPFDYVKKVLLVLMNRSINTGIPKEWKLANITMIPKNESSLTSCLGKFPERLIKSRLYKTLEEKNILVNQQSGFREKRGTADNLLFFSQKISETFERGKNACSIFFDISKAFDKVWYSGLIFKLNEIGV